MGIVEGTALGIGLIIGIGHVFYEKIQQCFLALICELAVCVAPLAVILIE